MLVAYSFSFTKVGCHRGLYFGFLAKHVSDCFSSQHLETYLSLFKQRYSTPLPERIMIYLTNSASMGTKIASGLVFFCYFTRLNVSARRDVASSLCPLVPVGVSVC